MSLILVPFDGSESGERAVRRAGRLASERDAQVLVLYVVPTTFLRDRQAQIDPASGDDEQSFAQGVIDRALALLAEQGVRAQGQILTGSPVQVILEQIRRLSPSLVVMGSRGLQDILPEGSVSRRVSEEAGVDVEVVR